MTRWLAVLVLAGCHGGKTAAPPDPGPVLASIRDFADRACGCRDEKACVRTIRDEYDTQKGQLLALGGRLVGDDKATFDAELNRLKLCGDGAGLTFWDH